MSRNTPPPLSQQLPLFSNERVIERTTSSGTTIRAQLRPEPDGMVTILAWFRRQPDGRWLRRPQEERTVAFEKLGLSSSFDELFGPAEQ